MFTSDTDDFALCLGKGHVDRRARQFIPLLRLDLEFRSRKPVRDVFQPGYRILQAISATSRLEKKKENHDDEFSGGCSNPDGSHSFFGQGDVWIVIRQYIYSISDGQDGFSGNASKR
jgi:hypothetical protein